MLVPHSSRKVLTFPDLSNYPGELPITRKIIRLTLKNLDLKPGKLIPAAGSRFLETSAPSPLYLTSPAPQRLGSPVSEGHMEKR